MGGIYRDEARGGTFFLEKKLWKNVQHVGCSNRSYSSSLMRSSDDTHFKLDKTNYYSMFPLTPLACDEIPNPACYAFESKISLFVFPCQYYGSLCPLYTDCMSIITARHPQLQLYSYSLMEVHNRLLNSSSCDLSVPSKTGTSPWQATLTACELCAAKP